MPVRRFIGYFIVLSTCATVAFGSILIGNVPESDLSQTSIAQSDTDLLSLAGPTSHFHKHRSPVKPSLVAQAN